MNFEVTRTCKVMALTGIRELEMRTAEVPEPAENDVLIKVDSVGICGSDVSYYTRGSTGLGSLTYPHVMGHECAGTVIKTGNGVRNLKAGDRVAVEPGYPCGKCGLCLSGKYNLCQSLSFMSTAKKSDYSCGAFMEYISRPCNFVYRLPDGMSFAEGAMLEPLSVAIHAIHRSGISAGHTAAILGSGPIALTLLLALSAFGVSNVLVTDVIESRLKTALEFGAGTVLNVTGKSEAEQADAVEECTIDTVFDTTCNEASENAAIRWLQKGGKLVQIGVPAKKQLIDLQHLFIKEAELVTSFRYVNTYPIAIDLVSSGLVPIQKIITQIFPFEKAKEAIELAAGRSDGVIKVLLKF